ncbi:MAG TPA: AarF/ABC1/UbiB kinase family protein [Phycisphaerae bacterium]|nr:AarF/ABC1/UbiB kinase family protein [Phycisphaerae bacterium]
MHSTLIARAACIADLALHGHRWRKSADELVSENARAHVAMRMGRLRGLPQKIGQILSMRNYSEDAEAFAGLTDHAIPLEFDEVAPVLRKAWGFEISDVVKTIDADALAASLGQVHRAILRDGRRVAVKVQYPRIRDAVMNDLKFLGWLTAPFGDLRRGFDLSGYRAEILRDLEDELDYRVEAENQRRFDRLAAAVPGWVVPRVIDEWSSETVLVTEWMEGRRIEEAARWPRSTRQELATLLIRGFFWQLFEFGRVHADPHPGNYRFVDAPSQPQVLLYDYGSVAEISPNHAIALLKLIEIAMLQHGDPYKPLAALGFKESLLQLIRDKLASICSILFEPFATESVYDLSRWRRGERMDDVLGEHRWGFRMSGPPWFVFVMRAFAGLVYYLEKLAVPVSWSKEIGPFLAKHREQLDAFDVESDEIEIGTFQCMARHLRVRVFEKGEVKVSLTFPAGMIDHLDELMDDSLRQRIADHGFHVDGLVKRARTFSYLPQELCNTTVGDRSLRVWLE